MTGIDAALENIEVAQQHASHDPLLHRGLRYMCITAEELLETERGVFDAVVASEVLEHVSDVEGLVATCSQLTKVCSILKLHSHSRHSNFFWLKVLL